jgi:hypothetical protein
MALNDSAFAGVLEGIFNDMWNAAENSPRDIAWYAEKLAKAIDDQIKTGDVQPGISLQAGEHSGATTGTGKIL